MMANKNAPAGRRQEREFLVCRVGEGLARGTAAAVPPLAEGQYFRKNERAEEVFFTEKRIRSVPVSSFPFLRYTVYPENVKPL